MRLLICAICLALTVAVSVAEISSQRNPVYDYHRRFGMREARRIHNFEAYKIVGGHVNDVTETPYQAGIVVQILPIFTSVCGASLISSTRLLTAAHCQYDGVFSAQHFTVVLGSNTLFSGGLRIVTNNVVLHPDWNPSNIANDIAIIRVDAITFTESIQPISLPSGSELNNDFAGWSAIASGFGLTVSGGSIPNNQPISSVTLSVIRNTECSQVFGTFVRNTNICTSGAGGKGICSGDSGGPLVIRNSDRSFVIGVSSFGSSIGCDAGFPSAFSRVTSYINWIQSQ